MFTNSGKAFATAFLLVAAGVHAQTVAKQIPFPKQTAGIAANSITDRIYVAAPSYEGATDTVSVIEGKTDKIIENISVPRGAQLPAVDLIHDAVFVTGCDFSPSNFKCIVTKIDGKTNKVIKTAIVTTTEGDGIIGIVFDPSSNKLYLANGSNNRVDVVDGSSLKVVDAISTNGREPFGISLNPIKHLLYVPYYTDQIQIFNTETKALVNTATYGSHDVATAVNWYTGKVFISDNILTPSTVGITDKDNAVVAAVPVSRTPYSLDIDLIKNKVYVLSTGTPALNVIDGATNAISGTLPGVDASYVSVNFASHKVYLSGNAGVTVVAE